MQDLYRVKKIEELAHRGTVRSIYKNIYKGAKEGISMEVDADKFVRENPVFNQKLKDNIWYFSTAKNRADLVAVNNLLVDEKGNFRNWNQFRNEAEKILGRSARFLKTEYVTAVAGARMSAKWMKFQAQKELYPYAKFFVVMDKHTSDICSPLNGVVVPWDHELLKTHYPPNHFNCRTDVAATRYDKPTPENQIKPPDIPSDFMSNVGMTGSIFSDDSKYMKALKDDFSKDEVDSFLYKVMSEEQSYIERYTSKKTGGRVRINLNPDLTDLQSNIYIAKRIVDDHKANVDILFHSNKIGVKNPELRIDGVIGDATHRNIATDTKPQNFIKNSFKKLFEGEQLGGYDKVSLVMNFGNFNNIANRNINRAASELQQNFNKFEKVEFVILISDKKILRIDRNTALMMSPKDFRKYLIEFTK